MLATCLAILAFGFLNRVRGGGFGGDRLPSRPIFWCAPVAGLLALAMGHSGPVAAMVGLSYLVWGIPPWGRWYSLGALPRDASGPPSGFEAVIESAADFGGTRRDGVAFTIRNALLLLPTIELVGVFAGHPPFTGMFAGLTLAVIITLQYQLAWFAQPDRPILTAELLTGLTWGATIATMGIAT